MRLNLKRDVRDGLAELLQRRVNDNNVASAAKDQYRDAISEIERANQAEDKSIGGLENATSFFEKLRQKWMTQSRLTKVLSGMLFAGILVGLGFISGPAAPICWCLATAGFAIAFPEFAKGFFALALVTTIVMGIVLASGGALLPAALFAGKAATAMIFANIATAIASVTAGLGVLTAFGAGIYKLGSAIKELYNEIKESLRQRREARADADRNVKNAVTAGLLGTAQGTYGTAGAVFTTTSAAAQPRQNDDASHSNATQAHVTQTNATQTSATQAHAQPQHPTATAPGSSSAMRSADGGSPKVSAPQTTHNAATSGQNGPNVVRDNKYNYSAQPKYYMGSRPVIPLKQPRPLTDFAGIDADDAALLNATDHELALAAQRHAQSQAAALGTTTSTTTDAKRLARLQQRLIDDQTSRNKATKGRKADDDLGSIGKLGSSAGSSGDSSSDDEYVLDVEKSGEGSHHKTQRPR